MAATAVAVPQSLSAQARKFEISGFAGWYLPTDRDAMQVAPTTRDAARKGSVAWGGRFTVWGANRLGLELVGGFSPARVSVAANQGIFPHSTNLIFGAAKAAYKLTTGDSPLSFTASAGVAGLRFDKSVADPSQSETKIGAVAGLGARYRLRDRVYLRGDVEDYFYSAKFGTDKSQLEGDLMFTGGIAIAF